MFGEEDGHLEAGQRRIIGGVVAALGFEADGEAQRAQQIARPDAGGDQHLVEQGLAAIRGDQGNAIVARMHGLDGAGDEAAAGADQIAGGGEQNSRVLEGAVAAGIDGAAEGAFERRHPGAGGRHIQLLDVEAEQASGLGFVRIGRIGAGLAVEDVDGAGGAHVAGEAHGVAERHMRGLGLQHQRQQRSARGFHRRGAGGKREAGEPGGERCEVLPAHRQRAQRIEQPFGRRHQRGDAGERGDLRHGEQRGIADGGGFAIGIALEDRHRVSARDEFHRRCRGDDAAACNTDPCHVDAFPCLAGRGLSRREPTAKTGKPESILRPMWRWRGRPSGRRACG